MRHRSSVVLILATVLLAITTSDAIATAVRWSNAAGGNWNVSTNWSPAWVPTASDTAVIDLPGTYTVTLNANYSVLGLRMNGSPSGVQTLSGTSRTLTLTGPATIGAQAVATLTSCTINGTGAITNQGTLTLASSTVAQDFTNHGTLILSGTSALNGTLATVAGSVVRVLGTTGVNAVLTAANGFTNNGTIELTSTSANHATLAVSSGTLVNAAGGSITALPGGGGTRYLTTALDNRGTITVAEAMSINKTSVAEVNSGLINLTSGNLTVLIGGTTPSFTTTGTINVPTGRTLTLQGSVTYGAGQNFYYSGGTLGGAGTVALVNSTLNLNSALGTAMARLDPNNSIVAGPATLTVQPGTLVSFDNSDLNGPTVVESGGTLEWTGASALNGTLATVAGSVVRVLGTTGVNAVLTAASGFTNNGTIELSSTGGGYHATLAVSSGTLVNAAGATITALPGTGGTRYLTAALDNRGTLTVATAMSINKTSVAGVNSGLIDLTTGNLTVLVGGTTPSFTTTGTINVPAGRTLTLQGSVAGGAGQNFYYSGGTLGGAGTVALVNSTLNLNSALGTAMAHLDGSGSIVAGPATLTVQAGTSIPFDNSDLNGPLVMQSGATLTLGGSTVAQGFTNNGTLVASGTSVLNGTLATVPGSVVRVLGTTGVNAVLTAASGFTNNGTIELSSTGGGYHATLAVSSGTLVNAAGATITALPGTGGTRYLTAALDNRGTLTVATAMSINKTSVAGVNSGLIDLTTGNLTVLVGGTTPSFTTTGTINVPAGRTLTLQGSVAGGAGQNFYYSGGTLGGAGTVALVNSTLNLNSALGTAMARLDPNNSIVAGPATLTVQPGTLVSFDNSDLNGPTVVESGGTLEWTGASALNGTLATVPGSVVRVLGTTGVNAVLTAASGFTNNGTIELSSTGGGYHATLAVSSGTLVNAAGATITALPGTGGTRYLTAALDNRGTLTVATAMSINKTSVSHVNAGTICVESGKTLTLTGASFVNQALGVLTGSGTLTFTTGTSFSQNGTVRPGTACGVLTINGPWPASGSSVHEAEIGSEAEGSYDKLSVRDAVTLDGALNISVVNGYQPRPGKRYVIATFPSRKGTFATVNGLPYGPGMMWAVVYSDTNVVLLAMDQTWVRVLPYGDPPAAREGHTAVYDSTGDRMIVFGGRTDAGVQNDVSVLTQATAGASPTWTRLAPSGTPPSPRTNAAAAYDPATNRMIVYGGDDAAATPNVLGDAWVLTNANGSGGAPTWIALAPGTAPSARTGSAAAYDRTHNRLILFGGHTSPGVCGGALADAWVLSNANGLGGAPVWSLSSPSGTPPSPRWHQGAAYDDATGRLVVTGGDDGCGAANTETWLLDHANGLAGTPTWTMLTPVATAPTGWSLARYTYDALNHWVDGFGGQLGGAYVDTAYTLTGVNVGGGSNWYRRLSYSDRPTPRAYHSMILNPASHTAVVFGGRSVGGSLSDLWRHQLDRGAVLAVDPRVTPPAPTVLQHTAFAMPPSPNPASGAVSMSVDVARDQHVDLGVFDVSGRRVATLHSGPLAMGRHVFRWTSVEDAAPGLYLVRLSAEDREQTLRVMRLSR